MFLNFLKNLNFSVFVVFLSIAAILFFTFIFMYNYRKIKKGFSSFFKRLLEVMKKNKTKIILWFFVILVVCLVFLHFFKDYFGLVLLAFFTFWPFFDRAIKVFSKTFFDVSDNEKILGLEFNVFVVPWLAFWGLWGVSGIYKDVSSKRLDFEKTQQITLHERKVLENDYDKFVNNLMNPNEDVRIIAIDSLYKLAKDYSPEFLKPVSEIFCGYIRENTSIDLYVKNNSKSPPKDIQYIINLLFKKDGDLLIFSSFNKSLEGSYLYGVDFQYAILNNVDFSEATLSSSNFKSAKLNNVIFSDAILNDMLSFEAAELTNVNFRYGTLTNVIFKNCKISNGRFKNSILTGVDFFNANINIADFGESVMKEVSFQSGSLENVSFRHASFVGVDFIDSYFFNVDFWTRNKPNKEEINFKRTLFENTDIGLITDVYYSTRISASPQPEPSTEPSAPQGVVGVVGKGKWGIVVASRPTKAEAESFGRNLRAKYGYDYEVISAFTSTTRKTTYRVFVDSFDEWNDRVIYENKWKNNPDCRECRDAWASTRRGIN